MCTFKKKETIPKYKKCKSIGINVKVLYEEVLAKYRMKYGDLAEFEAKLANAELPEHPYWEESIEYRNAYEELENLKKMKGVFEWILKSLTHREHSSGNANSQSLPRT